MAYKTSFELGTTTTPVNIETIVAEPPLATPLYYPVSVDTANGGVREHGGMACEWSFRALTETDWDALRVIIPGKSATVYIRTRDPDKFDYSYMTGIAIWPDEGDVERPTSPKYSTGQFVLRFRNLIPFTYVPPAP